MIGWPDNTGWLTTSSTVLRRRASNISSVSTVRTSKTFTTQRISAMTSPRCWPSTSSRRPPWPTDTAAATAGLGVVVATSGGGSLNLVAGLGESLASRVPVLALVGQPPTVDGRAGQLPGHQRRNGSLDAVGVVLRGVAVLRPGDDAGRHRRRAARGDRRRPIAGAGSAVCCPRIFSRPGRRRRAGPTVVTSAPASGDPQPIVRALRRARGPVTIIAGEQVARDDARAELAQLRSALGARVATVPDAKDVVRHRAIRFARGGRGDGPSRRRRRIRGERVVPAGRHPAAGDGTRRSRRRAGRDAGRLDRSGRPPFVPGTTSDAETCGTSLPQLADRLSSRAALPPASAPVRCRAAADPRRTPVPASATATRSPRSMRALPEDARRLRGRRQRRCRGDPSPARSARTAGSSWRSGWAAWATASAPASARRSPRGRRTFVIAGDGAFFMHGMEIHTAVEYAAAGHLRDVQQQRPRHVRDPRTALLRRRVQLQPVPPEPTRRRAGRDVPRPASVDVGGRRELRRRAARRRWRRGPRSSSIDCSADEIPPFLPFLAASPTQHHDPNRRRTRTAVAASA